MSPSRLFALRGAISVDRNDAQDILDATSQLMQAIMERNALTPEHVVSCIFTATNDLNAEFPAVAARALGLHSLGLTRVRSGHFALPFQERRSELNHNDDNIDPQFVEQSVERNASGSGVDGTA